MKIWFLAFVILNIPCHVLALEQYEKDSAVSLPDSVKEFLDSKKDKEDDPEKHDVAFRAIEDLKNLAEMSVTGKDSIRALQYLVIATELFPFRKDVTSRRAQVLEMAIAATNELAKLKDKNCRVVSKRTNYILTIAPDITTLQEAQQACAIKPLAKKLRPTARDTIEAKIPQQKLSIHAKDCDAGDAKACFALGILAKQQGKADLSKKYYGQACAGKDMRGCYNLGVLESRRGNRARAKKYYNTACEGEHLLGCNNLGVLEQQKGNKGEAKKYYTQACDGGNVLGCRNLGALEKKMGNFKGARKYWNKACDKGDNESCDKLEKLAKQGR